MPHRFVVRALFLGLLLVPTAGCQIVATSGDDAAYAEDDDDESWLSVLLSVFFGADDDDCDSSYYRGSSGYPRAPSQPAPRRNAIGGLMQDARR